MTRQTVHRLVVSLLLLGAVGVGVAAAIPGGPVLEVADDETGEVLLAMPVDDGTSVTLDYTHSVERTPIRDSYVVRDGMLVMTRMSFESYGWGLPAGADVELENGTFVYEPNATFAELTVKPGPIAGHRLTVGDETVDLVALADGRSVRFSIRERSALTAARTYVGPS